MFRNRTGSQKPNEELIASFKSSYPQLATTSGSSVAPIQGHTSLTDALDVAVQSRPFPEDHDIKDEDPTPRGNPEQWRFTPSIMDPNSFTFTSFANQPPGYYTPTPGGTNTFYHSQAGDLHTPGFTMGLGTPLSLPHVTSEGGPATTAPLHGFQPSIAPLHFQNPNPFAIPHHPESFAPHQFQQPESSFHPLETSHEDPSIGDMHVDVEMHEDPQALSFPATFEQTSLMPHAPQQALENFRYHVTLNAPTAMIKHADEIPVTYLNKGQAYSISVVDTRPEHMSGVIPRYRTFVRISFEDEQQRQRPTACWQLWKEGRGSNEAHHRGGRLQAVEFVDPSQIGGGELLGRPQVEVDCASFDGFAVFWSPPPGGSSECSIAVRFNFLSTDFSHSKGVKGIPVRLCTKTELVTFEGPQGSPEQIPPNQTITTTPETCYCKVKLFRDHGAERKLSNDVAHVRKSIEKLKTQISNLESGLKDFGKRKRASLESKTIAGSSRPGKVPKHKRTWSMSSASTGEREGSGRGGAEEDLHLKLATLQDMFTSTRPASVLYLKGEEPDDPDLHPVHLTGTEAFDLVTKLDASTGPLDAGVWERQSGHSSSIVSPTPSTRSIHSGGRRSSQIAPFNPSGRIESNEWRSITGQTATGDLPGQSVTANMAGQLSSVPEGPVKVPKQSTGGDDGHSLSGWIEAIGVDYSYQPPSEQAMKPIASFYILPRLRGQPSDDPYYRAIYLMTRTAKDLTDTISAKCGIDPTLVQRALRVNAKGLSILIDDDVVREMPEGMDMVAEFVDLKPERGIDSLPAPPARTKGEWDPDHTDIQLDSDIGIVEDNRVDVWELRLIF
ncbi:hypothetical protein P152DRAFT_63206 [Eremomyces bilateralis CBS 781.70]|uniref:Grh/CP2 DB domain-containing protein n=1 Tax=Eremomyces bilateralis CBS 781.70 TaxID=1392243 RepID=A0A6G1FZQ6_9PEZI|nr:uncharacterized protein P152DRAFT_63206 [Eremomyces bilateralis CBS 781.70]KAF1811161.1 hypothetical protein P152DRAFT_63206 [Eremomyces bilateralis CBS 781.70]